MSGADDYESEMLRRHSLDDDTIEDLLAGRDSGQADLTMIVDFFADVRVATQGPAPEVAPRLAALMADGLSAGKSDVLVKAPGDVPGPETDRAELAGRRRKKVAIAQALTGLGFRAKAAIGLGVAAVAVTGAGAAGALPGPAQHVFAAAVRSVTPFEVPDTATRLADFGTTPSSDPTGTTDGQPAADGRSIASIAPDNGLNVAPDTPTGDQVPTSVPAGGHGSGSFDDVSESSDAPDDPGGKNGKAPDDPGSQSSDAPDDPGSQNGRVPDDPGSQSLDAPDDPGPQNLKAPDDPGSGARGPGGRTVACSPRCAPVGALLVGTSEAGVQGVAQRSGCVETRARRTCPVSASGSTTTKRKG